MSRLYAVGETACNGVHGKNRLASNSLLESLVFAGRAARHIASHYEALPCRPVLTAEKSRYKGYQEEYRKLVLEAIEKERQSHECCHNETECG